MEKLFDFRFPKSQIKSMKKQLKERNEVCQRNMRDYFGLVELQRKGSEWTLLKFCDL